MKVTALIFSIIIYSSVLAQQNNTSIMYDNYINSFYGVPNPSTLVDSRSKFSVYNNLNTIYTSNFYAPDYLIYSGEDMEGKLYENKKNGYLNRASEFEVLGLKIDYDLKNSFGYVYRFRNFNNQTGIPETWNENAALGYQDNTNLNKPVDFKGMSYASMRFTEHVLTYSRVIYDRGSKVLKGGVNVKFLNGLQAEYLYANSGTIVFQNQTDSWSELQNLDYSYGRDFNSAQEKYKNRGFGVDLGFTYEIRPDYEKQYYDMDGEENLIRNDINKYKWKFFGSLTDVGAINFVKDTNTYNFTLNSIPMPADPLFDVEQDFQGPSSFVNSVLLPNSNKSSKQETKFRMNLPTTLHLGADYNIHKNWYASANMSIPLNLFTDPTRVSYNFIQTITPRYEEKMFSIMAPLSIVGNGKAYVGLAARLMLWGYSVHMGSNNIMVMFGQKASATRSFYFGLAYNILYDVPKDRDLDKVSDLVDICPDDKGPWSLMGCPDTDKDGILDKDDYCVYDAGSVKTNGCPDKDGDGIIDMNDRCPDEKGLGVHLGCPDRDFDGVIDVADKCPDVPGIELNNGCPFEKAECCMDNDGDGVSNNVDKCPDVAGSVYNDGCPITQENIDKINLNDKKENKDPNHTETQITETDLTKDKDDKIINSTNEYQSVFANKDVQKSISLYFDVDQANLNKSEQARFNEFMKELKDMKNVSFIVLGHTDRDGSLDYNLILSMKRAETVKRKITDLGFKKDAIDVYYFGESKALYKESYEKEQKKLSRKVEINVIKNK
jgi:outer membrane protein OmpA-like peptidoglycan-associated protein